MQGIIDVVTMRIFGIKISVLAGAAVAGIGLNTLLHWPRATDKDASEWLQRAQKEFYSQAYTSADELKYQQIAEASAKDFRIDEKVKEFVTTYGLEKARVLEVGAGRGYLQDIVENYTGLDLSPTAKRFFHKPFVEASATAMPFKDNEFDAAWTIWVVEHIPEPEKAFSEMRRVVKSGGYLYLYPAWNVPSWSAKGYPVRPYSDFDAKGKLVKASIPIRTSGAFKLLYVPEIRSIRALTTLVNKPSELHYTRLEPNLGKYWMNDSDGAVSVDWHETMLWYTSRGDECLSCGGAIADLFRRSTTSPLVIRIRK